MTAVFLVETQNIYTNGADIAMYKTINKLQHSFLDFNQLFGLHMNSQNRWTVLADCILWEEFEGKYADLFPSGTGNVAKPFRMVLGALITQKKFQYSDCELVERICENPYLQYFIGLPGYQKEAPFEATTLALITSGMLMEVNSCLPDRQDGYKPGPCGPAGAEKQEKLESIIAQFCKAYGFALPRRYRRKARKDYLAFAKGKGIVVPGAQGNPPPAFLYP